jgi:hypothetical protein
MFRIFQDAAVQERFEQDGVVQVPLLSPDEVALLREHYFEITRSSPLGAATGNGAHGLFVNLHAQDAPGGPNTIELLRRVLVPRVEQHCVNWKMHLGGYWIKLPGPDSPVVPHQDQTLVDDTKLGEFYQLTFWIALGDYAVDDGALGFVKGSHRFFDEVICSPGQVAPVPTRAHKAVLSRYLTFPELGAGEAFAFNTRTVHAGRPHRGTQPRICASIALTPSEAELYHYFLKPGTTDRALKIAIDDLFQFTRANMHALWLAGRIPEGGRVVGELPHVLHTATSAEVEELCVRHGNVPNDLDEAPGLRSGSSA